MLARSAFFSLSPSSSHVNFMTLASGESHQSIRGSGDIRRSQWRHYIAPTRGHVFPSIRVNGCFPWRWSIVSVLTSPSSSFLDRFRAAARISLFLPWRGLTDNQRGEVPFFRFVCNNKSVLGLVCFLGRIIFSCQCNIWSPSPPGLHFSRARRRRIEGVGGRRNLQ